MLKTTEEAHFLSKLTLGVIKSLEARQGVCDVKMEERQPVEKHALTSWEQKYSCLMPDDVKNFYLTTNGFRLKWSTKMNETRIPVGRMEINTIENLVRIGGVSGGGGGDKRQPSLTDINMDIEAESDSTEIPKPKFDHRSRIFELDPCDGFGKVCLVYNNTKPENQMFDADYSEVGDGIPAQKANVWFLDRSLQWHYLATDFMSYFRLMLVNLGLPQWQYAFTDIGLPPQSKQWFNMYAPVRLDRQTRASSDGPEDGGETVIQQLDVAKVFKGKSDKKKQLPQLNQVKKRPGAPSARSQTFMGRPPLSQGTKQIPK